MRGRSVTYSTITGLLWLSAIAQSLGAAEQYWWLGGAKQTKDRLLKEAWWIWHEKDVWGDPEGRGVFLFSKDIDLGSEVKSAEMRISGQISYVLSINGKEVGQDDQVITLERYDIKPFLQKGRNQLAVTVNGPSWRSGLFLCGTITLADGTKTEFVSDRTWQISKEGSDTSKPAAEVVRGVDGGIWNNVGRLVVMPDAWYRLNTAVACPGIAWAKPFAGRKLKVVVMQPRGKQRDTVELLQRTDLQVIAVFPGVSSRNYEYSSLPFFPPLKGVSVEDALAGIEAAMVAEPDVIVWGGVSKYCYQREKLFYKHLAERLASFVAGGGGLIYLAGTIPPRTKPTGKKDKRGREIVERDSSFEKALTANAVKEPEAFLSTGTPFEALPGFYGVEGYERTAALYTHGKGRVVRLNRVGSGFGLFADRGQDCSDLHYQYYLSFAIKATLWAAGEIPEIQFRGFPQAVAMPRGDADNAFTFDLTSVPDDCEATMAVRSPLKQFALPKNPLTSQGVERGAAVLEPVYETIVPVTKGDEATVRVAMPDLPAGDYFVDVIVKHQGKNANWAAAALAIEDELRIADLTLSKEFLDIADGKTDEIEAQAVLSKGAPTGSAIRFALLDNYDRVLATKEVALEVGVRGKAVFPVSRFATTLGKVRAELVVNGKPASVRTASFTVIRRDWDRFTLFAWTSGPSGHQGNVYLRTLAELGLDASEYHKINLTWLEAADRVALPSYPFPRLSRKIGDLTRLRDAYAERARQTVESQYRYDPIAFTHGNEFFYGGGDEDPDRVRDYQAFLTTKYKTMDALNEEWDSDYRYFEDVYPLSRMKSEDLQELKGDFINQGEYLEQAEVTRNYSRFVDQWLNNYRIYYELGKISLDTITSHFPAARLGFDCPMWPHTYSGHDWYKVMSGFGFFAPYGRGGEIIPLKEARSYLKPGQFIGLTYGGYLYMAFNRKEELTDTDWHRWRLWNGLMQGFSSIWWYTLVPPGIECNLGPGFEPFPTLTSASENIAKIRRGYYTLLNRIRRDYGPIAIHDSIISRITSGALPQEFASRNNYGHCMNVHVAMHLLETICGHQYTFVSDQQILKGELSKYGILILPTSFAIGAKEASMLQQFVSKGGVLLADVRPGLFNASGKWDGKQAVPSIFGLSYKKALGRKLVQGEIKGELLGHKMGVTSDQPFPADPAVELNGAKALCTVGGVPLVTVNEVGKGKAVCLNIPFTYYSGRTFFDCQYAYWGHPDHNRLVSAVMNSVLEALDCKRPVKIDVGEDEAWPFGLEIARFQEGAAEYIGLTKKRERDEEPARRVTVHPTKKGHVYDALRGEYVGETEKWEVTVDQVDVHLFAVLPYKLDRLDVSLSKETVAQGEDLGGTLRVVPASGRPVRHVVHLDVIRPDGKTVRYLSRNLETEKPRFSYFPIRKLRGYGKHGVVQFTIPIALNEPKGTWQLVARDVATGTSAQATFEVR